MLRSVDRLCREVIGPLQDRCGPQARVLTAEVHGDEVRGLAFCPGKVLRYVLEAENRRLKTTALLRLARSSRQPAA
ncbi:hypothetical protein [Synechococcus sp. NOUM97013]|uniref:hypothetical protein n=1 Tax=Synechococcus sp. NOUM97013 TaxID=1442555 RepID=UPI00164769C2|nr:hypothetical protein [Synechococcus sp. NOUM97013]QNI73548.1 hypothetical protein SynNOUM97013_01489 [Synechococcus sp. NOUM97013]